jgi:hypothetical protein
MHSPMLFWSILQFYYFLRNIILMKSQYLSLVWMYLEKCLEYSRYILATSIMYQKEYICSKIIAAIVHYIWTRIMTFFFERMEFLLLKCTGADTYYILLVIFGKSLWHMCTSDPFTFSFSKILKSHTSMSPKIMLLNIQKDIYMRSVHQKKSH